MPLSQAARIARLNAEEEKIRAAQQAAPFLVRFARLNATAIRCHPERCTVSVSLEP
jgi:hypothetical protein